MPPGNNNYYYYDFCWRTGMDFVGGLARFLTDNIVEKKII
jgi:hypothetical protein